MSDVNIKVKMGPYTLIDDGNGVYLPDRDQGDRLVDSEGMLISEKSPELREIMGKLGISTFHGIRVKRLPDYLEALRQGKTKIQETSDLKVVGEGLGEIFKMAHKTGVDAGLRSALTSKLIREMGSRGYMIPLIFAQVGAESGEIEEMEEALEMTEIIAVGLGQNITPAIRAMRHEGYHNILKLRQDGAKVKIERGWSNWLSGMEKDLLSIPIILKAKHPDGTLIFTETEKREATVTAAATRKLGYETATQGFIDRANKHVENQYSKWLEQMDTALRQADKTALTGEVYDAFADKINEARRSGYDRKIQNLKVSARKHIENGYTNWLVNVDVTLDKAKTYVAATLSGTKTSIFSNKKQIDYFKEILDIRREGYRKMVMAYISRAEKHVENGYSGWLNKMNSDLNKAIEYVKAEQPGTEDYVFPKHSHAAALKTIEENRKAGYRKLVEAYIKEADGRITNSYRGWLDKMNAELEAATKYSTEGKVAAEFVTKIQEIRTKGYRKAVELTIAEARKHYNNGYSHWVEKMNGELKNARTLAKTGGVMKEFETKITGLRHEAYESLFQVYCDQALKHIENQYRRWQENATASLKMAESVVTAVAPDTRETVFSKKEQGVMKRQVGEIRSKIK